MTSEQRQVWDPTVKRLRGHLAAAARARPGAWKAFDYFRSERGKGLPAWPAWCYCPMKYAYAIFAGEGKIATKYTGAASALAAMAAWRASQGIYVLDETVLEYLWQQESRGELPTDVLLRLPEWGIYVAFPKPMPSPDPGGASLDGDVLGFFAHLEYDVGTGEKELRFCVDCTTGLWNPMAIELAGSLDDSNWSVFQQATLQAATQQLQHTPSAEEMATFMSDLDLGDYETAKAKFMAAARRTREPFLSICLYLCADNADISGGGQRHRPRTVKTKAGPRMFAPDAPTFWEVAYRVGAKLRLAEQAERVQYVGKGGSHASPRAHIRNAHWHHFWTGAKAKVGQQPTERKLILKWIPPLPINVDEDHPVVATIHEVGLGDRSTRQK